MSRRIVFLASALTVVVAAALMVTSVDRADAQDPGRIADLVVVPGSSLSAFVGADVDELWTWWWADDEWRLDLIQVDERDAAGEFVAFEDGVLDGNDDVVVPYIQEGRQAPAGSWPQGMEQTYPWAEVVVTEPLAGESISYMYVFRSVGGPEIAQQPHVTFDETTNELTTSDYVLGMADPEIDGFAGLKRLSLFGSAVDVLDRLKIRAVISIFGIEQTVTEESLALLGQLGGDVGMLSPDPIIVGPVRAVFDAAGAMTASRLTVDVTISGLGEIGGLVDLKAVRASLDFSADAVPATYGDPNTTDPVAIDGSPDEVATTPLPRWREMAFENGRVVVVAPSPNGGDAEVYYKDDSEVDGTDTGDGMSYGDNGVASDSVDGFIDSGFPGHLFLVPKQWPHAAADLVAAIDNPLVVNVNIGAMPPTITPGGPTVTPSATPTMAPTTAVPTTAVPTTTVPTQMTPTTPNTPAGTDEPGSASPVFLPLTFKGK